MALSGYAAMVGHRNLTSSKNYGSIRKKKQKQENAMFSLKKVLTYMVIALMAAVSAFNYQMFIFPNSFAPAGLNGVCTMIRHLSGISVGYMSLIINIPLAIWVYLKVSRTMGLRSMVYVGVSSVMLVIFNGMDMSAIAYATENGTSTILGPRVAGIVYGAL